MSKQAKQIGGEYVVELVKPIQYRGIIVNKQSSAEYTGIYPINVDNTGKTISFEPREFNENFNAVNQRVDQLNNILGTNSTSISNLEQKHNQQQTEINDLKTQVGNKQDPISAGDGISLLNNLVAIQSTLLDKWNGYQASITTNQNSINQNSGSINTIKTDITSLNASIEQLKAGLQQFPIFEIVGDWVAGTTYRKNQAVYHNKGLWNSKINNNTKEPSKANADAWFLISNFNIPLGDYLTKVEAQTLLNRKQDLLTGVNGVVINQDTKQVSIETQLLDKWNNYQTELTTLNANITNNTNAINTNTTNITNNTNSINTINTTLNNVAKKNEANIFTTDQEITGNLKINRNAYAITLKSRGDKFIEWKNGNTREAYLGRPSSTNNKYEFKVETARADLYLSTNNGSIISNSKITIPDTTTISGNGDLVHKKYVDEAIRNNQSGVIGPEFDALKAKVETNITSIGSINNTIQGHTTQLQSHFDDINHLTGEVAQHTDQITTINSKNTTQDTTLVNHTNSIIALETKNNEHTTLIEQNKNNINDLIQQLRDSNIVSYVGQYVANKTYKLGQVVSFNNDLYLCKVDTTVQEPTNKTDWDLLSAPVVDLSQYYTKQQVDQKETALNNSISANNTAIGTINSTLNTKANLNTANTFSAVNTFNEVVNVLNDKKIQVGYSTSDIKLIMEAISETGNARIRANRGDLILDAQANISLNRKKLINVNTPTAGTDAANKSYVDTKNQEQTNLINQNTTKINQLIQQLRDSNIINYVGNYQAGTTYKLGQVVSFNDNLYLCKVQTTTNEPTNKTDWDLLSAPEIDLSNYFTKAQIEQKETALNNKITANTTSINNVNSSIETINQALDSKVGIEALNNTAKVNTSNTFTTDQVINGNVKINRNGAGLTLQSGGDKFIEWKNGNTRESYIGRGSASSRDFDINLSSGNLNLKTNGGKIFSNSDIETTPGNGFKALKITLGYGGTPIIRPDEGTNKPLRFSDGNVRFGTIDLQNQTKLANVPNIRSITVSNISQNMSKTHNLPAGSIVLSIYNNSTGKNNPNFVIKDNGELTITNNDGVLSSYVVKYWEV